MNKRNEEKLIEMEKRKQPETYICVHSLEELDEYIAKFPFYSFSVVSNPIVGQVQTTKPYMIVFVLRRLQDYNG